MALARLNDFVAGTPILDSQVDAEFNQLVGALNGVDSIEILHKFSHATTPVINANQLNTAVTALLVKGQQNSVDTFKIKANGYIVGYSKTIHSAAPNVGNSGAGLDTLFSFDIPINSLANDLDYFEAEFAGFYSANNNDKRLLFSVAPNAFEDTGVIDIDNLSWNYRLKGIRVSATALILNSCFEGGVLQTDSAGVNAATGVGGRFNARAGTPTNIANLNSNVLNLLVQAEGVADNDITIRSARIMVCQMT
jgi:hypothetical protein